MLLARKKEDINLQDKWYLNTKASIHMYGYKDPFIKFDEIVSGQIYFGDSTKIPWETNVQSWSTLNMNYDVIKDKRWKDTIEKVIDCVMRNKTWELTSLSKDKSY